MEVYIPDVPGTSTTLADLQNYVVRELQKLSVSLGGVLPKEIPELHVEPTKVKDFLTVAADGTDWNPGAGQGVYTYYAGAWHKLG